MDVDKNGAQARSMQGAYFTTCAGCAKTFGQLPAWPARVLERLFHLPRCTLDTFACTAAALCQPCQSNVLRGMRNGERTFTWCKLQIVRLRDAAERAEVEALPVTPHVRTLLRYMTGGVTPGEKENAQRMLLQLARVGYTTEYCVVQGNSGGGDGTKAPVAGTESAKARAVNAVAVKAYLAGMLTQPLSPSATKLVGPSQQPDYGECHHHKESKKNGWKEKKGGDAKGKKGAGKNNKKPGRFARAA